MNPPDLVIFDLDGTLHRGAQPIPSAIESVAAIRKLGAQVRFLTNNASKHRTDLGANLRAMGFGIDDEEVYSSALGAAIALNERGIGTVFPVGEAGLIRTLEEHGIQTGAPDPEAVVAGICRELSYGLVLAAMHHIGRGAEFWATNTDTSFPAENGQVFPGAGATVGAIRGCTGVAPHVVGKPEPYLVDVILRETGVGREACLVVGDRLDTDIEAGRRAGCRTHLVLSGITTESSAGLDWSLNLAGLSRYWNLACFDPA